MRGARLHFQHLAAEFAVGSPRISNPAGLQPSRFLTIPLLPYHTTSFSSHLGARPHHHRHPPPPQLHAHTIRSKHIMCLIRVVCVCAAAHLHCWCTLPPRARTNGKSLISSSLSHPPRAAATTLSPYPSRLQPPVPSVRMHSKSILSSSLSHPLTPLLPLLTPPLSLAATSAQCKHTQ